MKKKKLHEPYSKVKGFLREHDLTYSDLAETLGVTETTIGFKINGLSDFYLSEVKKLQTSYGIPLIFFSTKSCENDNF